MGRISPDSEVKDMRINTVKGVRICAVAGAVSTKWKATDSYSDVLGQAVIDSFKRSSGVEGRYLVQPNQTAGDLCYAAAKKILTEKKIDPRDVGALVFVTQSPDYGEPATACVLQYRLGLSTDCYAFDVTLGCSGYAYGLNIVSSMMANSNMRYGLLLAGDTKGMEPTADRKEGESNSVTLLLGDAGTATLLEKVPEGEQCDDMVFMGETDGSGFKATGNCWRGYRHQINKGLAFMDDLEVFNYIMSSAPRMIRQYMEYTGTTPDDYDCFALHQASLFTLKQVARKIGTKMDKVPLSLNKFGNTGPASIPMALVSAYGEASEKARIKTLMCGFGVGLSISASSAVLNTDDIYPVIETDEWFNDGMFDFYCNTEENR